MKLNTYACILTQGNYMIHRALFFLVICIFVAGCQHTETITVDTTPDINQVDLKKHQVTSLNLGQYYLQLTRMTDQELLFEAKKLQTQEPLGNEKTSIQLALLYSLPNSPLHNVYTAKSALNQQLNTSLNNDFTSNDNALIKLLRDQLNQQLYLIEQLIRHELKQTETKKTVNELSLKVDQLHEKITQLKKIEQAINERGL